MREIRTLRAMWRGLETELRSLLNGHEEGNLGHTPRRDLRATAVAVGTTIADRPPHRSVQAELPHTALPLDMSVKTNIGIWMQSARQGDPSVEEWSDAIPVRRVPLTSPAQQLPPESAHARPEPGQCLLISRNSMVAVICNSHDLTRRIPVSEKSGHVGELRRSRSLRLPPRNLRHWIGTRQGRAGRRACTSLDGLRANAVRKIEEGEGSFSLSEIFNLLIVV